MRPFQGQFRSEEYDYMDGRRHITAPVSEGRMVPSSLMSVTGTALCRT